MADRKYRIRIWRDGEQIADIQDATVRDGRATKVLDTLEDYAKGKLEPHLIEAFRKGAEYAFRATGSNDGLTVGDEEAKKELGL